MRNIFFIALNTIKEIKRHKIFYALATVVLFIIGTGVVLGPLSLSEQTRLSINFSFTACHIGLILIAVYFGSTLISHEVEKKTAVTLFVKPISRLQFIIGKFFGLSIVLLIAAASLAVFIVIVHFIYEHPIRLILFFAMWGILLEALILLAVAFFFSSIASSFLVLVYSFLIFIIGHSANGIVFLLGSESKESSFLVDIISKGIYAFPNFEKLNWRGYALYQDTLLKGELLFTSLYSLFWMVFLLAVTSVLFERKQIV